MTKPRKRPPPPALPIEDAEKLVRNIDLLAHKFEGQLDELESAVGMLMMGRLFGWKVLVLIHNKRTIRKYEEILGISVRDAFPEEGPLAYKSMGLDLAKKLGNFWKAVSGDVKVEHRRELVNH